MLEMARILAFAGLLCAAFASPHAHFEASESFHQLVRRDASLTVVETALYNISNYTVTLGDAINNFVVDYTSLNNLQLQTDNVLGAIDSGIASSATIANLTTEDVVLLTSVLDQLVDVVNVSVTATIKQKTSFGGLGPVILSGLQKQLNATLDFQDAVSSKIPSALVAAAAAANAPIVSSLESGISVFSTPNVNTNPDVYSSDATIGVSIKHVGVMMAVVLGGMFVGSGLIF